MIWLLGVIGLRWAGLHWFAALALVMLAFSLFMSMDPLLLALEFARLRQFGELLALPLIFYSGHLLLQTQAERPGSAANAGWTSAIDLGSGLWLVQPSSQGRAPVLNHSGLPALLVAPSALMLLLWLVMNFVSPGRTPALEQVFLAGLVPGALLWVWLRAVAIRSGRQHALAHGTLHMRARPAVVDVLSWLVVTIALVGFYLGRWALPEAAALSALALSVGALITGRATPARLTELVLAGLRDFGQVALLLGLGLAWAAVVFDGGLDRGWLARSLPLAPGTYPAALIVGLWLGAAWAVLAWLLKPLPALVVGAPFLIPAALIAGLPPATLATLSALALYFGYQIGQAERGSGLSAVALTLAATVLVPALTVWLPARLLGSG